MGRQKVEEYRERKEVQMERLKKIIENERKYNKILRKNNEKSVQFEKTYTSVKIQLMIKMNQMMLKK